MARMVPMTATEDSPYLRAALEGIARQVRSSNLPPADYAAVSRTLNTLNKASQEKKSGPAWARVVGTVLKPLSVPQAALATTIHNTIAKLTGDKTIPWSAAKGDYYRDSKGRTGFERFLEENGIKNRAAKLGVSLVADPLWLVGAVAKPASLAAKAASTADKSEGVARSVRLLTAGANDKVRYPTRPGTITLDRGSRYIRERVTEALEPIARGRLQGPGLPRMGAPRKYAEPTRFQVYRSRPSAPPKATNVEIVRTARGTYVGKTHFIMKRTLPDGKVGYQVFELAEPGARTLKGAKRLKGTTSYKEAVARARKRALDIDWAKSPYNTGGATARFSDDVARAASSHIEDGKFGSLLKDVVSATDQTHKFAKSRVGPKDLYLRLGVGNRFSKDIRLGRLPGGNKGFTAAKGGVLGLGRSPLERGVHQLRVSSDELTQVALHMIENVKANFARATGLSNEALDQAAKRAYLVAAARNHSPQAGEMLRQAFIKRGLWDENYDDLLEQFTRHWERQGLDLGMKIGQKPGPYAPQGPEQATLNAWMDEWRIARRKGETELGMREYVAAKSSAVQGRKYGSAYAYMTHDQAIDVLVQAGLDPQAAAAWVLQWDAFVDDAAKLADEPQKVLPELDLFKLASRREQAQMRAVLDRQVERLAREAGILDPDAVKALRSNELYGGPLARTALGRGLMVFTGTIKTILTTINAPHFVRNAVGDYINRLINGNLRHASPGASWRPGSGIWKLAKGDREAMAKMYDIGDGRMIRGDELAVEAAMMGLGRGYVGSDIAQMMDMYQGGLSSVWGFRQMTKLNMNRENAQRLETYLKHRRAGDDMFTAASKTLRVHFDYSDLSDIEKVFLRNVLLFYTWLRRNTMLQASGVITRPALYNAMGNIEEYRPKFEDEPDYIARSMPVGIPGVGYLNVGNPMSSLNQLQPDWRNFREAVLGSLNPAAGVPISLGTNTDIATGYDISRYPGDLRPSLIARIIDKLGGDLPYASPDGRLEGGPALPARLNFLLENLFLLSPYYSTTTSMTRPRDPDSPQADWSELIGRMTGLRPVRPDAAAAARNALRRVREAERTQRNLQRYRVMP